VDVTSRNLGRDPAALQRIARETGLSIVMGCGWYTEPYYDRDLQYQSVNQIAEGILRDIVEGVDDTGARAGIIGEIGCDLYHISPVEERVLRAAARVQERTGLAITTHASRCPAGLWQLDILEEEGVDLRRAIVGHCDLYPHPEYHEAIARRGAYVAFDTIRGLNLWDMQCRIEWLKLLVEKGYVRQILISQDVCMKSYTKNYGGQGYDYILTKFVPMLRESGLSKEQIHILTAENPRAALTGVVP
jgi:phosphotriesterase-related protein